MKLYGAEVNEEELERCSKNYRKPLVNLFDLYFAGTQSEECLIYMEKLDGNKLCSYVNDRTLISLLQERKRQGYYKGKLMIDSGAYSAYTKGTTIDIDRYIEYINSCCDVTDYFIALDIIPKEGDSLADVAEAGYQNYLYMIQRVVCPEKIIPVHHAADPMSMLKKIVETKLPNGQYVPYICLGGIVGTNAGIDTFLRNSFDIIKSSNNPFVKVHALGLTSLKLLERFPITSSDSTAWIMTGASGNIFTKWGVVLVSNQQLSDPKHLCNMNPERQRVILEYVRNWGFELEELMTEYKKRMSFNIRYFREWSNSYIYKPEKFKFKKLF